MQCMFYLNCLCVSTIERMETCVVYAIFRWWYDDGRDEIEIFLYWYARFEILCNAWGRVANSASLFRCSIWAYVFCFQLTLPLQSVAFRSSGEISSVKMLARTWRMISSSWFRDARNNVVINGIFCIFILRFSREIRPLIVLTTQWMLKTQKKMHTETNIELNELNEFKLTRNLRNRHATTKIFLHFIFFFFSFFVSSTIFRLNLLRVLLCESGQFSSVLFPLRRNFNFFFPNSRFAIFNTSLVRRDCFIRVMWTRIPHIFSIFFFFSNSESNAVRSPWQNIKNSLI